MGLMKDARHVPPVAVRFDPNTEEIRNDLNRMKEILRYLVEKSIKKNGVDHDNASKNSNLAIERISFDPLEMQNSSVHAKQYTSACPVPPNYVEMLDNILFRGLIPRN